MLEMGPSPGVPTSLGVEPFTHTLPLRPVWATSHAGACSGGQGGIGLDRWPETLALRPPPRAHLASGQQAPTWGENQGDSGPMEDGSTSTCPRGEAWQGNLSTQYRGRPKPAPKTRVAAKNLHDHE